jgi:hypothetical protein
LPQVGFGSNSEVHADKRQVSFAPKNRPGFQYEGTLRQKAWFKGAFHDFRMFGRISGDAASAN